MKEQAKLCLYASLSTILVLNVIKGKTFDTTWIPGNDMIAKYRIGNENK